MPPKAKFTKEQIVASAIEVTKQQGIGAVTAREIGRQLGTSSTPVFVAFENMDELKKEVYNGIRADFYKYICEGLSYTPVFKGVGLKMIEYSVKFPNLFAAIYTNFSGNEVNYDEMVMGIAGAEECLSAIKNQTGFNDEDAALMFRQVLISGFGICYLISVGNYVLDEKQLDEYLGLAYAGAIAAIKSRDTIPYKLHPKKNVCN